MKKTLLCSAALAALTLAGTSAQAQVFTSLSSFNAAINDPGAYTETFTQPNIDSGVSFTYSGGTPLMSYTLSVPGSMVYRSGSIIGNNSPNLQLVITFNSGNVRAVGGNFFITNITDEFQAQPVTLTFSDGQVINYTPTSAATFRGYVSNTILTSVTMSAPTGGQFYNSMDNFVVSAVPEPMTMGLLAMGAAALIRRRKQKKS